MKHTVNTASFKSLRMAKGWTQEQLAEKSGVHTRTIQRIENSGVASSRSVKALAAALETSSKVFIETELPDLILNEAKHFPEESTQGISHPLEYSLSERERLKGLARESQRLERWLSYNWIGWPLVFIGAFLTVSVLLLAQASLNKALIFTVFLPGVTIGVLFMFAGQHLTGLADAARREQRLLRATKINAFRFRADS